MSVDTLLSTLAFTATRVAAADFADFTVRLQQALATAAEDGDSGLRRAAAGRLEQQAAVFQGLLRDALQQSLLEAAATAAAEGRSALKEGALDLSLQTFEAMQRKVQIDNLSQAIDRENADQLAILGMRVRHLLCPDEQRPVPNPFRAESFVGAVTEAWSKFDRDEATLPLVLQCLRPKVFLRLGNLYLALNGELSARGILPDAEKQYWSEIPELTVAVQPSLQDRMQAWLAPEGTLKLIPVRAASLLLAVFEELSNDERLPFRVRKSIAQVAEPVGPLLQRESGFFFDDDHPARLLLREMYEAGLGGAADSSDALSQAAVAIPARLMEDPGTDLAKLADELHELRTAQDRANAALLETAVTEARRREAGAAAQRLAQADIASRLESGEVDAVIEDFLQTQWLQVVAFAHRVRDSKPELLPNVLKAMDELVWSLKPKTDAGERQRLVERLPHLLSLLNAWMNVIKWQGEEREAFFAALADAHAAALRGPADAREELALRMEVLQKGSEHELARRADEQQREADAAFRPAVDALQPGDWVELVRNNGSKAVCRLAWVSPGRSRLVFIVPHRKLVFGLGADELARALRLERAEPVSAAAWMEQAFEAALDRVTTPA